MNKIFKFCKKYFFNHISSMLILFVILLLAGLCTILLPLISGSFIDYLVNADSENSLLTYCLVFALLTIANIVIGFFANRIYTKLNLLLTFEIAQDIIQHSQRLTIFYFYNRNISQLTQQINIDTKALVDFCFDFLNNVILNFFKFLGPLIIIFTMNRNVFIIVIILIIIYAMSYTAFRTILYKSNYDVKERQNIYFAALYEQLSKIKFLKIFAVADWFNKKIICYFQKLMLSVMKLQIVQYSYSGLDTGIMSIGQICLFIIGGSLVLKKVITIGDFTVISTYFSMVVTSTRYFFGLGQQIQTTLVSFERLQQITREPEEIEGRKKINSINKIEICNVNFSYGDHQILQDVNICLKKGFSYALLGHNGTGKTTLVNILIGLYRGYTGEIYYDDYILKELDTNFLRKERISVIEQEPSLIQDTLYKNIILDGEIAKEEIKHWVDEWLTDNKFRDLDMQINEKSNNISGGERERIAIIRAIVKDSDLIIMDEPTASLDKESSYKLKELIKKMWKDKIVLVITHDDALAKICDYNIYL